MRKTLLGVLPGKHEVVTQPLYDFQNYDENKLEYQFFAVPIGQQGKTLNDTNMELCCMFPQGKAFLILKPEIYFFHTDISAIQETYNVLSNGSFGLMIGCAEFRRESPLMVLKGKSDLMPNHFYDFDLDELSDIENDNIGILITPVTNFCVTLSFKEPIKASGKIGVRLLGDMYRRIR